MIASGTAQASKFERPARPGGLAVRTWIKFKTLYGILEIVKFQMLAKFQIFVEF